MSAYSKPHLTPPQQVALLQSRGMEITDVAKAEQCLSRIGYYRLSAYWYPFRDTQRIKLPDGSERETIIDDFKAGTSFATCLDFYVFDKRLRLLVLDALERVEIGVRTDIALLLGNLDPSAHRNVGLLHGNFTKKVNPSTGKTTHQTWLEKQDKAFQDSKEDFAKHFKRKYPGSDLPIWMAVELWDFGMLSFFFAGMKVVDQNQIAQMYGFPDGKMLENWLRCLNVLRNTCAHHSRLWNKPLVIRPSWPKVGQIPSFDHALTDIRNQTRFYGAALILKHLLTRINPSTTWGSRLADLMQTLPDNLYLTELNAGFPKRWPEENIWKT